MGSLGVEARVVREWWVIKKTYFMPIIPLLLFPCKPFLCRQSRNIVSFYIMKLPQNPSTLNIFPTTSTLLPFLSGNNIIFLHNNIQFVILSAFSLMKLLSPEIETLGETNSAEEFPTYPKI